MPTARRTEAVEHDLRDIAFQIAVRDQRPLTAERLIDQLIEQAETLARLSASSQLGTAVPEVGAGVRLFPY